MNLFFGLNDATSPNLNSFLQNIFLPNVKEIDSESKPLSNKIASLGEDKLDLNPESSRFTTLNKLATNSLPTESTKLQQRWYKLAAKISKIHGLEQSFDFSVVDQILRQVLTYSPQIKEVPKLSLARLSELRKQNPDNVLSNFDEKVISPGLVAAIVFDELMRVDREDQIQNESARDKLSEGNIDENTDVKSGKFVLLFPLTQKLSDTSIGMAQIKPSTYIELVEKGYLEKPHRWNEKTKFQIATKNILDESQNAEIVAAYLYRAYNLRGLRPLPEDTFHKSSTSVNQKQRQLASLYSGGMSSRIVERERSKNIALMAEAFDEYFSAL